MQVNWKGVIPAQTTPFNQDLSIDHGLLAAHARWMVDAGCVGLVPCGSLGEGATLTPAEKLQVLATLVRAVGDRVPILPAVASTSTAESVRFVQDAGAAGASGFMVLPPYVYSTDWREMKAHMAAILAATDLPSMLYNNPVAYRTDFLPAQIAELAREFPHLAAVKESSTDVRRVTAIRALIDDRLEILMDVDDAIVEGIAAGAIDWIAGLVNAFPHESVDLFNAAREGRMEEAFALYRWFLPLLRLDTVPKFVQLIKLVQEKMGWGSARVRPPRLELVGPELAETLALLEDALRHPPGNRPHLEPALVAEVAG
jgi:4-hydroxy-tetrahydrodipicolinate synthase